MSKQAGSRKKKKEKSWLTLLGVVAGFILVLYAASFLSPKDKMAQMERVERDGYAAILWEGREYVPWGAGSGGRGGQIGYVDGDKKDKVYALKGKAVEEWIINAYGRDGAMLYREKSVTEIPPELGKSEYPWNP